MNSKCLVFFLFIVQQVLSWYLTTLNLLSKLTVLIVFGRGRKDRNLARSESLIASISRTDTYCIKSLMYLPQKSFNVL